jgi:cellulose synthase/poly-beta-1,6-N-acetylglucosamine synthase-like glycosyltransferase
LIPALHCSRSLKTDAVAERQDAKEGLVALTISTIVCAYNEARYLAPCLHSLLAQSRRPDELLVVNNASTDDTAPSRAASTVCGSSTNRARDWCARVKRAAAPPPATCWFISTPTAVRR